MLDIHRGFWKVGTFPRWVMVSIQAFVIYQALARGLDYIGAQPTNPNSGLVRAESAAPFGLGLSFWGFVFVGATAIFLIGFTFRWWSWITAAHVIIAVSYFAVTYGLFLTAFENVSWQGIRTPSGLFVAMLIHGVMAAGTAALARQSSIRRGELRGDI
ncbi:hypothetical protein ACFULT_26260 [Rhodococcus sp. NPDC057297]|uniref:hypothetical protein n=1 Tax=Rhodococcus sp. NPDC057297 TaxID=3346090 RepID=UPI00362730A7